MPRGRVFRRRMCRWSSANHATGLNHFLVQLRSAVGRLADRQFRCRLRPAGARWSLAEPSSLAPRLAKRLPPRKSLLTYALANPGWQLRIREPARGGWPQRRVRIRLRNSTRLSKSSNLAVPDPLGSSGRTSSSEPEPFSGPRGANRPIQFGLHSGGIVRA